ncbi:MAG: glycosyltransferase family 2 protein [Candidatus Absconditabacterales bacterium]|nr:glycosyltransferase family 2 protein [Candidatus Absconditabacterales bacterium]
MKISVVTTLYCSEKYIEEFYKRILNTILNITKDYEIIFVNDGSPDNSLLNAIEFWKNDKNVKIINLSKNFGHHKAMMTGLKFATGDYIFLIDVDLEEEPELLEIFWKNINSNDDIDVVYGVQRDRKGKIFEKITGKLFYKVFNFFSNEQIPENIITARLMKKNYVNSLIKFQESEIFIGGLWEITGFIQIPVQVKKILRIGTTYTFRKKIALAINAITSFSAKPLIWIFNLGVIILIFSILVITYFLYNKLMLGVEIEGWTSLILSIWFVGGLVIFSNGIIGIYLSKIFIETKNRPNTIIKNTYGILDDGK